MVTTKRSSISYAGYAVYALCSVVYLSHDCCTLFRLSKFWLSHFHAAPTSQNDHVHECMQENCLARIAIAL